MLELSYNCYRRFNVDILMLYFSAVDHARKSNFSSYVHLPSINKISQYRYTRAILCNVAEVISFKHGRYFQLWNILGC